MKIKDIFDYVTLNTKESIADSFVSDLNYSISKYNKEHLQTIVSKSYKPSSLHCVRNMYYQVSGTEIDSCIEESGDSIGIAESGTDRHQRIQEAVCHMKDSGIDCEYVDVETYIKEHNLIDLEVVEKQGYETKLINTKYNFRFLCDGIIKYKGKYYILEIKTETSFKWNNRINVDPGHYNQAIAYSINFGINDVIFLYENRDTCSKKSYLYTVNETQKTNLLSLIKNCDECVNTHTVPPIPNYIKYNSKICNYCQYKKRCKSE